MRSGKKVRFALVGCGAVAHKHLISIARLPEGEVVGLYDIDPVAAKPLSGAYQIPYFRTVEEMIDKTDPDILNILTPSGLHAQTLSELVPFKRHFVVEKPLALNLADIDGALRLCEKAGLKVFVVQQNRFNPPIQKLKEALNKERFGKLVLGTVRVRWCREQAYFDGKPWRGTRIFDGGIFLNQASHHVDMLIWMMGEVESVMAKTATRVLDIETEDVGIAILKFKSGALGVIEATIAARPKDLEGSISILGEKGSVEVSGFFMNELKTWNFSEPDEMDRTVWSRYRRVPDVPAWSHSEFMRNVIASVKENKQGLVDGIEGRKSVELINAIYESAASGREVFLNSSLSACCCADR